MSIADRPRPKLHLLEAPLQRHLFAFVWLPRDEVAWTRTRAWIAENDGPFKQALDRCKYPSRYPEADVSLARLQAVEWLQQAADQGDA